MLPLSVLLQREGQLPLLTGSVGAGGQATAVPLVMLLLALPRKAEATITGLTKGLVESDRAFARGSWQLMFCQCKGGTAGHTLIPCKSREQSTYPIHFLYHKVQSYTNSSRIQHGSCKRVSLIDVMQKEESGVGQNMGCAAGQASFAAAAGGAVGNAHWEVSSRGTCTTGCVRGIPWSSWREVNRVLVGVVCQEVNEQNMTGA